MGRPSIAEHTFGCLDSTWFLHGAYPLLAAAEAEALAADPGLASEYDALLEGQLAVARELYRQG